MIEFSLNLKVKVTVAQLLKLGRVIVLIALLV
jgi:hypothetical protein